MIYDIWAELARRDLTPRFSKKGLLDPTIERQSSAKKFGLRGLDDSFGMKWFVYNLRVDANLENFLPETDRLYLR